MYIIRTSDGYEFETTLADGQVHCVCRRDGYEASITAYHGAPAEMARVLIEPAEMAARSAWIVGQWRAGRIPRGFDPSVDDGT